MTQPDRRPLTRAALEQHLAEQLQFLEASAAAFDGGFDGEAKRLAVTLRILLHDTSGSHSLLGQLGLKDQEFWDTALPPVPGNKLAHGGLVMIAAGGPRAGYVAMLDDVPEKKRIAFNDWWNASVFVDPEGQQLSRARLVQVAANQDGGAHVDRALDGAYARLAAGDLLGWMRSDEHGAKPMPGAERAAIRQIAHEVLKTLKPGYSKKPSHRAGVIFGGVSIVQVESHASSRETYSASRNDPCPCGSGKKFKKCHGDPRHRVDR